MIQFHSGLIIKHGGHLITEGMKIIHVSEPIHEEFRSVGLDNRLQGVELLSSSDIVDEVMATSDR